jgi:FMN phosphatase YigB (HAD superfamily)
VQSSNPPAIILDFDNTLYDWVAQWYASFMPLLEEVHKISGVSLELLKSEIRKVHQRHHTSEYSFLIQELDILRDGSPEDTIRKFAPAIAKSREGRENNLRLYPGVMETLQQLKNEGRTLAVFTESQTFYTVMRFKKLKLEGVIDYLFTSEDHETPNDELLKTVRAHPPEYYEIRATKHRSVGRGRVKPDPHILDEIVTEVGATKASAIYVGDSLYKDVAMAKDAGVFGVWAEYGEARGQPGYDLLREVSHWTQEDVEKDRLLKTKDVVANAVLKTGFAELLPLLKDLRYERKIASEGNR